MVCIFMANGFEEVEALTVVDILRRANIDIKMVSINNDLKVTGAHNIQVITDCLFKDVDYEKVDMLILPGGMPGTNNLKENEELKELLLKFAKQDKYIAAICAAPIILGEIGIVKGKKVTCYPGFEKYLKDSIIENKNIVKDSNIVTAKGLGVADDFALELVNILLGEQKAFEIKKAIIHKNL